MVRAAPRQWDMTCRLTAVNIDTFSEACDCYLVPCENCLSLLPLSPESSQKQEYLSGLFCSRCGFHTLINPVLRHRLGESSIHPLPYKLLQRLKETIRRDEAMDGKKSPHHTWLASDRPQGGMAMQFTVIPWNITDQNTLLDALVRWQKKNNLPSRTSIAIVRLQALLRREGILGSSAAIYQQLSVSAQHIYHLTHNIDTTGISSSFRLVSDLSYDLTLSRARKLERDFNVQVRNYLQVLEALSLLMKEMIHFWNKEYFSDPATRFLAVDVISDDVLRTLQLIRRCHVHTWMLLPRFLPMIEQSGANNV
jgi:hypothetical protein